MRRRFQRPKPRNVAGYWIAQFRDLEGRKRKVSLGPVARVRKYDAEAKLAQILEPINSAEPVGCLDSFRSIKNPGKSLPLFKSCLNAAEMRQSFWIARIRFFESPRATSPGYADIN